MISYLAMMSNFHATVESWNISSQLFAYKVIPFVPRMITFVISGRLYRRPNIESYVRNLFIPSKLKDVEIITGYYSYTKGKIVLSTNMNSNDTLLKHEHFDLTNADTEHCDGNFEMIFKSVEATTNVPFLLPNLTVMNTATNGTSNSSGTNEASLDERVDYGIHSPSPLTFVKNVSPTLKQVIYFSPINIEKNYTSDFRGLLFINMIQTEITRLSMKYNSFETYTDLTFLSHLVDDKMYLLIIYTTVDVNMSIGNFTSFQSKEYVKRIKENTKYRLYIS